MKKNHLITFIFLLGFCIAGFSQDDEIIERNKEEILGIWYSENDINSKWVYTEDNMLYVYFNNQLHATYKYSISHNCGINYDPNFTFLKKIFEDGDEHCSEIGGVNEEGNGLLSLISMRNGKPYVYKKYEGSLGALEGQLGVPTEEETQPTPYELCQPILYKIYQEHGAKINHQSSTIIYNSIERIIKTISDADFEIINTYYNDDTGNSKLTASMIREMKYYFSSNNASINYFVNWLQKTLEKEALNQFSITAVRFEGCKNNNDCIVRPEILFGGFVKFRIENGMAIVDNLDVILGGLSEDLITKFAASYGYSIQNKKVLIYKMIQGAEDNFNLSADIRQMQDDFKDKILSYIVPKYANKARFKFCEEAYYNCTCIKPCPD